MSSTAAQSVYSPSPSPSSSSSSSSSSIAECFGFLPPASSSASLLVDLLAHVDSHTFLSPASDGIDDVDLSTIFAPELLDTARTASRLQYDTATARKMTYLIAMSFEGEMEKVKVLLQLGADVNAEAILSPNLPANNSAATTGKGGAGGTKGSASWCMPLSFGTPLRMARYAGHREIVYLLASHPFQRPEEAASAALEYGFDELLFTLVRRGTYLPSVYDLSKAAGAGHSNIVRMLTSPPPAAPAPPPPPPSSTSTATAATTTTATATTTASLAESTISPASSASTSSSSSASSDTSVAAASASLSRTSRRYGGSSGSDGNGYYSGSNYDYNNEDDDDDDDDDADTDAAAARRARAAVKDAVAAREAADAMMGIAASQPYPPSTIVIHPSPSNSSTTTTTTTASSSYSSSSSSSTSTSTFAYRPYSTYYSLIAPYSLARALCDACKEGQAETVKVLLAAKANGDGTLGSFVTEIPIILAAAEGEKSLGCLQILIENGANVNRVATSGRDEITPLRAACKVGCLEGAKMILAASGKAGIDAALQDAAAESGLGKEEMMTLLLEAGANPSIRDGQGKTLLYKAATIGTVSAVEKLLKLGVDVNVLSNANATGMAQEPPLLIACEGGHGTIVKLLLEKGGANVLFEVHSLRSPLILAAGSNSSETLLAILHARQRIAKTSGGKPISSNELQLALLASCTCGNVESIKALVEAGANPNGSSGPLITPLIVATTPTTPTPTAGTTTAPPPPPSTPPPAGPTVSPLLQCAVYGHVDAIRYLLSLDSSSSGIPPHFRVINVLARSVSGNDALAAAKKYAPKGVKREAAITLLEQAKNAALLLLPAASEVHGDVVVSGGGNGNSGKGPVSSSSSVSATTNSSSLSADDLEMQEALRQIAAMEAAERNEKAHAAALASSGGGKAKSE